MPLKEEIQVARREIVSDGYQMSVGEIINLYKDKELVINPAYQRLYRWDIEQKTRFIESLILGIPIPPIFVYQIDNGGWELIDGLQRLSTIFEFMGILEDPDGAELPPLVLESTKLLPSLEGTVWLSENEAQNDIGQETRLLIKRARLRVEILQNQSHPLAKFELFQRLNTGGSLLSPQEVRTSIAIMLDPGFQTWVNNLAEHGAFSQSTGLSEHAIERQSNIELVVRFISQRHIAYVSGDVNEYLDAAIIHLANDEALDRNEEERIFKKTFSALSTAVPEGAFKRWDNANERFTGKFSIAAYEVIATGLSRLIDQLEQAMDADQLNQYIRRKIQELWANEVFQRNSGAGVRGTTRLANLLPFSQQYFAE